MTPYHYFIGCKNNIINNDDNECTALQRNVEVPKWREDKNYEKNMNKKTRLKKNLLSKLQEGSENMEVGVCKVPLIELWGRILSNVNSMAVEKNIKWGRGKKGPNNLGKKIKK